MGIFDLFFKARLDSVNEILISEDFRWYFLISCTNCGEENDREIYLNSKDLCEISGSRGTFNFAMKCKVCAKVITISILPRSVFPYHDSENFQKIAQFDVRGAKITHWRAPSGFNVVCGSGFVFEDINIEEADWVEYDNQGQTLVGVYEIETKVENA